MNAEALNKSCLDVLKKCWEINSIDRSAECWMLLTLPTTNFSQMTAGAPEKLTVDVMDFVASSQGRTHRLASIGTWHKSKGSRRDSPFLSLGHQNQARTKETNLNTWQEHISCKHGMSSMNIESQAVLRIEVGEERLKKVATKKLTPHCLEQQPLAALWIQYIHISVSQGLMDSSTNLNLPPSFSELGPLDAIWKRWCICSCKTWRITLKMNSILLKTSKT